MVDSQPDILRTLAALADPTRHRVVELLRQGPTRAGDLAAAAQVSPAALSRHLRLLRAHGLVEVDGVETDARLRVYRLRQPPFAALRAWLDQVDAFWGEHLDAFAAHADQLASSGDKADEKDTDTDRRASR